MTGVAHRVVETNGIRLHVAEQGRGPAVLLCMLPGCGHWTQQERPAEVNAELLSFLRGLEG